MVFRLTLTSFDVVASISVRNPYSHIDNNFCNVLLIRLVSQLVTISSMLITFDKIEIINVYVE